MAQPIRVRIDWSEVDEAFVAVVPELPGCAPHGDSFESALANCSDAIALGLETAEQAERR
jgi:predicted RNase H-like HicB family nuclease